MPPGGELAVKLRFTPTKGGKISGKATIHSNDPDEPAVDVPLKGKGKAR